ncbi:hypothetical protein PHO31112_02689 [Pandoraea horticolens]|uniref:Uncharacterized protein n=1 Tax=Pandoraea horticolens TaxID=2508298 RepID=A0A5E4VKA7_9BURK|nr:hypothetical protein PHO31112_02689 [Pandoraea horticolens]
MGRCQMRGRRKANRPAMPACLLSGFVDVRGYQAAGSLVSGDFGSVIVNVVPTPT